MWLREKRKMKTREQKKEDGQVAKLDNKDFQGFAKIVPKSNRINLKISAGPPSDCLSRNVWCQSAVGHALTAEYYQT